MNPFVIFIFIICGISVLFCLYIMFKPRTKEEKEYDRKLKESLKDEYIIDPETGAKITLEQAESGHWIAHDNEFKTIPKVELDKLPTEGAKQAEIALNYLRESKDYRKTRFSEEQLSILEGLKTFKNYDDWSYSDSYKFEGGAVFLPSVELNIAGHYRESHLMFWVKIDSIDGHYYFREKSSSEKLFDLIRNDDEIKSDRYECFTIKKSHNIIQIKRILGAFEKEKGLEIEIKNDNLFFKTLKLVSLNDINRIEKILTRIIKF